MKSLPQAPSPHSLLQSPSHTLALNVSQSHTTSWSVLHSQSHTPSPRVCLLYRAIGTNNLLGQLFHMHVPSHRVFVACLVLSTRCVSHMLYAAQPGTQAPSVYCTTPWDPRTGLGAGRECHTSSVSVQTMNVAQCVDHTHTHTNMVIHTVCCIAPCTTHTNTDTHNVS